MGYIARDKRHWRVGDRFKAGDRLAVVDPGNRVGVEAEVITDAGGVITQLCKPHGALVFCGDVLLRVKSDYLVLRPT